MKKLVIFGILMICVGCQKEPVPDTWVKGQVAEKYVRRYECKIVVVTNDRRIVSLELNCDKFDTYLVGHRVEVGFCNGKAVKLKHVEKQIEE